MNNWIYKPSDKVIVILIRILNDNYPDKELRKYHGLCHLFDVIDGGTAYSDFAKDRAKSIWAGWKYYTGLHTYPVPSSDPDLDPVGFFFTCDVKDYWTGEQLMYRKSLIRHLFKQWGV